MTVHTSAFDAVFGSDPLARFTAAVITATPEFDPGDTPIGHALAAEFFRRTTVAEPETAPPAPVLVPERVYEWPAAVEPLRRPSPRPRSERGTVLALPVAPAEWFDTATTEPDEDIEQQVRRAG